MQQNVGNKDRAVRIAAGVGIITIGAFMGSWWGAIGIVPIATGLMRWCPAYAPLGISTCETSESGGCCAHGEADKPCATEETGEAAESDESGEAGEAGETEKGE
jgi:hypothetical protein